MTERFVTNIARYLLGGVFLLFGLNFFFGFLPLDALERESAMKFMQGLHSSGYFMPFLKGVEIFMGLFLVLGFYVPLALVILMPVTLNVFLFNLFLDPASLPLSIVLLVSHIYLAWVYRSHYAGLFKKTEWPK